MYGLILVFVLLVLTLALRVAINIIQKKKHLLEKYEEEHCETCLRWSECNGVDEDCPLRKEHE